MACLNVSSMVARVAPTMRVYVFFTALVCTAFLMPVTIWLLTKYRIHDVPNERSSHQMATIRGTGIAIAIGCLASLFFERGNSAPQVLLICVSAWFGMIGFTDDLRSLSAKIRLGAQIAGSLIPIIVYNYHYSLEYSPLLIFCGSFGIIAYVNAFNFMDGVNFISVLQTGVVAISLIVAGNILHSPLVALGASVVLGASIGFVPFNGIIAKTFMGDVGSYFLGAWLSVLSLLAFKDGSGLIFIVSLGTIYFSDTGTTLVKRILRKERWMAAHRQHEFQRLVDMGYSHLFVSLYVTFFSALACICGLYSLRSKTPGSVVAFLSMALISMIYLNGHRYHFLTRWAKRSYHSK